MIYATVTEDMFAAAVSGHKAQGQTNTDQFNSWSERHCCVGFVLFPLQGHLGRNRTSCMNKLMIYDILMTSMLIELLTGLP